MRGAVLWLVDAEPVTVEPKAGERAQPWRPHGLVLCERGGAGLEHRVLADRVHQPARLGVIEPDPRDVVVSQLHADGVLHVASPQRSTRL
jgi:hypothetical protein